MGAVAAAGLVSEWIRDFDPQPARVRLLGPMWDLDNTSLELGCRVTDRQWVAGAVSAGGRSGLDRRLNGEATGSVEFSDLDPPR